MNPEQKSSIGNLPAFPQHGWSSDPKTIERMADKQGITYRQWLIGKALSGCISMLDSATVADMVKMVGSETITKAIATQSINISDAVIQELDRKSEQQQEEDRRLARRVTLQLLGQSIDTIGLNYRARTVLADHKITTVAELVSLKEWEMLKWRNFGAKSILHIREKLSEKGLSLNMKLDDDNTVSVIAELDKEAKC